MSPAAPRRALSAPLQVLAAAVLVTFLAAGIPSALSRAGTLLELGWKLRGESATAALARTRGAAYWAGVERVKEAVPRDGEYLLAAEHGAGGMDVFLRFDLAPRRARYLGEVAGSRADGLSRPADAPSWVVIARRAGRAPRLVRPQIFFSDAAEDLVPGRLDDLIPCNVDDPANGASLSEPLVLRGWCQERGGRPCSALRIVIDGEERTPYALERHARPDVEAAVRGIGACDRAGFRATFRPGFLDEGAHTLTVFFLTGDGRYRRTGPARFIVAPASRP